jgi:hypothetical protein
MNGISVDLVWFDSLGAKSACTFVSTPDVGVLIDPGVAAMQRSYPAPPEKKLYWKERALEAIKAKVKEAGVVVISHYHNDHYLPNDIDFYMGKLLLAKNPNEWINDSQRRRAEEFFSKLCEYEEKKIEFLPPKKKHYADPISGLPLAASKDFGDYNARRKEVLQGGRQWFEGRVERWGSSPVIPEFKTDNIEVRWPEGQTYRFGKTTLRFTPPLMHGVEYSRVGWVFATVVERGEEKFIHSSDLNGPIIEDYAKWIVDEDPNVLILDGPMTYMLGYMLNKINLGRAIQNAVKIIKNTSCEFIIYDHHLPREVRFRERTEKIWRVAEEEGKKVLTAAEYLGKTPMVLTL